MSQRFGASIEWRSRIVVFGTNEPTPALERLTAGPLSVESIQGVARRVSWHGIEVVRAIDCPIRDESWATCSAEITDEVSADAQEFRWIQRRVIAGGTLTCHLNFIGRSDGVFRASAELLAHRDFQTNRAGFTVLHPLEGLTGSPLTIRRKDGSSASARFPLRISPGRVAFDIGGLEYTVCGVETKLHFRSEIFEMEDQRNWSDASFKTYCRPLARPVPYRLAAGETIRQEIEIYMAGGPSRPAHASTDSGNSELRLEARGECVPAVALALDPTSIPDSREASIAHLLAPRVLQLRVNPNTADAVLASTRELAGDANPQIELEIVVPQDGGLDECLAGISQQCQRASIQIARVMALPEAYLRSYQPEGPWPEGPSPQEACKAARKWFPDAQIGGGVLTHFAELNRCRPEVSLCDYLLHGSTAILHAADDRSVIESLEGLSHVYASARALADGRDYRLGLVSIGMRSNPHGADVAPNPEQIRVPMARIDPRQRGLFAAAWAVGAVAATEEHCVSSMALAMPVGPFGLIYRRADWPQPLYDEEAKAVVYPLFHVVRALTQLAGARRFSLRGAPRGVVGIAAEYGEGRRLILANLREETCRSKLPQEADVRRLDPGTFDAAITTPEWLFTSPAECCPCVALAPYSIAFVDMPRTVA